MHITIHAPGRWIVLLLLSAFGFAVSPPGQAVEGALDRPITGMQVTPFAGVIQRYQDQGEMLWRRIDRTSW